MPATIRQRISGTNEKEPRRPGQFAAPQFARTTIMLNLLHAVRLDYLSCILTVLGTVLLGKKLWQGWVVCAINSAVVCVIGLRTAQFGFVPANLFCIALYTSNVVSWRFKPTPSSSTTSSANPS